MRAWKSLWRQKSENNPIFSIEFLAMTSLQQQINQLKLQVRQLVTQHVKLQKETSRLQLELEKKEKQLAAKDLQLSQLQPHADAVRLEAGLLQDEEKKELTKRIDAYIKEIDQCLALLNQ